MRDIAFVTLIKGIACLATWLVVCFLCYALGFVAGEKSRRSSGDGQAAPGQKEAAQ